MRVGNDRYPYVSKQQWLNRGWTLVRKVCKAGTAGPTDYDRRVAMLLLEREHSLGAYQLRPILEEIAYGTPESTREAHAAVNAPQEDLG